MNGLKRNFWLYAIGELVSLLGSGIQMIAIPLYIIDSTGSGTMTGIFVFLSLIPLLLTAPLGGVLGDRWNRKYIMVTMDFSRGIIILLLAFIAFNNQMSIYILFISQVLISSMDSFFNTSTEAMLPEIVTGDNLIKANSLLGVFQSSSMILGPILGGIIYAFGGIKLVFLINGVSFVISAISELFIKYKNINQSDNNISYQLFFRDFKDGLRFIKSNNSLLMLLLFFLVGNFLLSSAFAVVIPFALKEVIGFTSKQYGIIQSMFTVGILLGNLALTFLLAKIDRKRLIKIGLISMGLINLIFALTLFPYSIDIFGGTPYQLFVIISLEFVAMGLLNTLFNIPIHTNFQTLVPNDIRSRVFSARTILLQIGVPFGAFLFGVLLDKISVQFLYLTISILLILRTLLFILFAPKDVYEPKQVAQ